MDRERDAQGDRARGMCVGSPCSHLKACQDVARMRATEPFAYPISRLPGSRTGAAQSLLYDKG